MLKLDIGFLLCYDIFIINREGEVALRLLKCYGEACVESGTKHPKEELTNYHGKNYCSTCYITKLNNEKNNERLYEVIKRLYRIPYPDPRMKKQVKDFIKQGLTYDGIIGTLEYIDSSTRYQLEPRYGLSLVLNFYNQYEDDKRRKDIQANNAIKQTEEKIVTVARNRLQNNLYAKNKLVSFKEDANWLK